MTKPTELSLDTAIWQLPVSGQNLVAGTLADQLDAHKPTLLIFLRHFG